MDLVCAPPVRTGSLLWQPRAGAFCRTLVCKLTYALAPGESPLAEDQEEINEHDHHWNDDERRSLYVASDLAPRKARPDVTLVGNAFAPGGEPVRSLVARLVVGSVDKQIEIVGERSVSRDGAVREPMRFAKMPLRYERAAGGPGTTNPVGVRVGREVTGPATLPNLQPPGTGNRFDAIEPISFGPAPASFPSRRDKLGRHPASVLDRLAEEPLPEDFDFAYFNVAPADQQPDKLQDGERIVLHNLHREHQRLSTSLPGSRPRAFVERDGGSAQEVTLRCDTLWIDTDRAICTLTWRGEVTLAARDERGRLLVGLEARGARLTYESLLELNGGPRESRPRPRLSSSSSLSSKPVASQKSPALAAAKGPALASSSSPSPPSLMSTSASVVAPPAPLAMLQSSKVAAPPAVGPPPQVPSPASVVAPPAPVVTPPSQVVAPPAPVVAPPAQVVAPPAPVVTPPSQVVAPPPVGPGEIEDPPTSVTFSSSGTNPAGPVPSARASALPFASPASAGPPATPPAPAPAPPARASDEPPRRVMTMVDPPVPGAASMGPAWLASTSSPGAAPPSARPALASSPALEAPAPRAPRPRAAPRFGPPESIDVLWYDRAAAVRLRAALLDSAATPAQATPGDTVDGRIESDVAQVLATAQRATPAALDEAMAAAAAAGGRFRAPAVVVAGELRVLFDELEALRLTVSAALPFAIGNAGLREVIDASKELLGTPWLAPPSGVVEGLAQRVRDAFAQGGRPPTYLSGIVERGLLERRAYQRRSVLGAPHLRALLLLPGAEAPRPLYLLADIASALPMFTSFDARLVAEIHPTQDQAEASPFALRALALGRMVAPLR